MNHSRLGTLVCAALACAVQSAPANALTLKYGTYSCGNTESPSAPRFNLTFSGAATGDLMAAVDPVGYPGFPSQKVVDSRVTALPAPVPPPRGGKVDPNAAAIILIAHFEGGAFFRDLIVVKKDTDIDRFEPTFEYRGARFLAACALVESGGSKPHAQPVEEK